MPDPKNKKHRDTIRINKPSKIYKPNDYVTEADFEKQFAMKEGDAATFPQYSVQDYSNIQVDDKGPYVVRNSSNQMKKNIKKNIKTGEYVPDLNDGVNSFGGKYAVTEEDYLAKGIEKGSAIYAKISSACKAAAKRKFKVWPSAYASGWGVRCTKAGGPSNFGGKKKK